MGDHLITSYSVICQQLYYMVCVCCAGSFVYQITIVQTTIQMVWVYPNPVQLA